MDTIQRQPFLWSIPALPRTLLSRARSLEDILQGFASGPSASRGFDDAAWARLVLSHASRTGVTRGGVDRLVRLRLQRLAAQGAKRARPIGSPDTVAPALLDLSALATRLTGTSQSLRTGRALTHPTSDGLRVEYLSPEKVEEAYACSLRRTPSDELPRILVMLLQQLDLVTIHPLTDGNGRCSRFILASRLVREWRGLPAAMPLGAMTAMNIAAFRRAFALLRAEADPAPYLDILLDVVGRAIDAANAPRALTGSSRSTPRRGARF